MEDRVARLEARVADLAATVASLQVTVAVLQGAGGGAAPAPAAAPPGSAAPRLALVPAPPPAVAATLPAAAPPAPAAASSLAARAAADAGPGLPTLAGRAVLVLAGAFLLRMVTESGRVSQGAGVALGLAYAALWTGLAHRAGRRGRTLDATFHGAATAVVGFPLLWEASVRFGVLGPGAGAAILAVLGLGTLAVAWAHRLVALAGIAVLSALATGAVLLFATHAPLPYAVVLLALGAAALWAAYHRDWPRSRWAPALGLCTLFLLLGSLCGAPHQEWLAPGVVAGLQLALVVVDLGSFVARTLGQRAPAGGFEITLAAAVFLVGFEGAVRVLRASGASTRGLGALALALGAACAAGTFLAIERRRSAATAACYTTLAALLAL
ncbi:MAG TPA: hypothetical protein VGQ83_25035, partial [Polyangia bacterium]